MMMMMMMMMMMIQNTERNLFCVYAGTGVTVTITLEPLQKKQKSGKF